MAVDVKLRSPANLCLKTSFQAVEFSPARSTGQMPSKLWSKTWGGIRRLGGSSRQSRKPNKHEHLFSVLRIAYWCAADSGSSARVRSIDSVHFRNGFFNKLRPGEVC